MKRRNVLAPEYKSTSIRIGSSDSWRTPQHIFDKLNEEFNFEYDLAADESNAKCYRYYTLNNSAFNNDWTSTSFANIPYSSPKQWFAKAAEDSSCFGSTIVLFVKVATSEMYWEYAKNAHIRYLKGRVKFVDEANNAHFTATFGNAIIIWSPDIKCHNSSYWDYRLEVPLKLF